MLQSLPTKIRHRITQDRWFWIVFGLGIFLRAWAVYHTVLINPDGALYIYQAKAIFSGKWHNLTTCGLTYVGIYSFLVAAIHLLFTDWILSAQAISFIFSTATLVPLYFLCRHFVNEDIAALTMLVAALNPEMCSRSGDVVRDPVYWFFLAMGTYYIVRYWYNRSAVINLTIASIALILASWARIEAILPLTLTPICLLFLGAQNLWRRILAYSLPIFLLFAAILVAFVTMSLPMDRLLHLNGFQNQAVGFIRSYDKIRLFTENLVTPGMPDILRLFLLEAMNHIWLIALGTMLNRTLETFFYPFVPFFLIGLFRFKKNATGDSCWWYLFLSSLFAYILLYFHLLGTWIMEYRFMMLVMIPGLPFAAKGFEWIVETIGWKWYKPKQNIIAVISVVLLVIGLPKNLQRRDPDKIVFRQVALRAMEVNQGVGPVLISSSIHTHRLLSLYANINLVDPPCPEILDNDLWDRYADDISKMVRDLKQRNIDFFLFEERYWPAKNFAPENSPEKKHFELIGQWYHRDTHRMLLYKIK